MYREGERNEFKRIVSGPVPTEPEVEVWKRPEELLDVVVFEYRLKLVYRLNGENVDFVVSAPSLGGIRFTTSQKGFFDPRDREPIRPVEGESGTISFQTTDGTEFCLERSPEWRIEIRDARGALQYYFTRDSISFGYRNGELVKVRLEFAIDPEEILLGMGERFSDLDQNGNRHFIWNTNCEYNRDSDGIELWRSYKNIPLLHRVRGSTLFYASYYPAVSDLGYTDPCKGVWEFWGPEFDLFIWTGTLRDRIKAYTDLTGKPFLPPKWAFRYMAGAGNRFWYGEDWRRGNIPDQYLKVLKNMLAEYRRLGTPAISALYGEGWIADNKIAYEMLNVQGIRMLHFNPPDFTQKEMQKYLPNVPKEEFPRIRIQGEPEGGEENFLDFFNENARVLIRNRYNDCFIKGMRGGTLAYDEFIPEKALYCNGATGREMHNWNPYWYTKIYGEAAREIVGDDYIYFCRGACAGSQQWAAVYSGDQPATLYGLRQQLHGGLSIGLCGFSIWSGDMAGYEGTPDEETFIRGVEFSAFQPLMRAHGVKTRCPWDFGKQAEEVYVRYYWLRENFVELLYSAAVSSSLLGLPMMKAMALAFPEEESCLDNGTQYLFCDALLVAPVLEQGARTKQVYFPRGSWYELWNGARIEGGEAKELPVSLTDCPAYFKAGVVAPVRMHKKMRWAMPFNGQSKTRALLITPPEEDCEFTYYANEKDSCVFQCKRENENTFSVVASGNVELKRLLIYGKVSRIQVDGQETEFSVIHRERNITALKLKAGGFRELRVSCG